MGGESGDISVVAQALQEASQKVQAKVQEAIQQHLDSSEFSPSQGLDFLRVKNSLMLTYLIELTYNVRKQLKDTAGNDDTSSMHRLTVMKTVLDKSRGLEKKLRYQIDKLMAAGTSATSFVETEKDDPLQFRPDTSSLRDKDYKSANGDEDSDNDGDQASSDDDEVDADLAAARATVAASRGSKTKGRSNQNEDEDEDDDGDGVYRAPRLSAVPYNLDRTDKDAEREKRKLQRMRTSELAQALRSQYGEAPEQEDIHGGTELGKQREASRRFAQQQEEKTQYEEDAMIRLTTTRKEKKERKRIMTQESSNLSAIADLGNIVRDAALGDNRPSSRSRGGEEELLDESGPRHKRLRDGGSHSNSTQRKSPKKGLQAKNSLQAALYGDGSSGSKSKKGRESRR
uniref:Neuroguidin n=1 Tax=Entomoneis paludosa TaxID=265537 RepID=A0A7S2Y9G3_9STRA